MKKKSFLIIGLFITSGVLSATFLTETAIPQKLGKIVYRSWDSGEASRSNASRKSNSQPSPLSLGITEIDIPHIGTKDIPPSSPESAELETLLQKRIEVADRAFNDTVTKFPYQEHAVMASFTKPMPIQEVVEEAKTYGLTIEGFRHSSTTHSGGYTIPPGEPLDIAVIQYEHDMLFSLEKDIQHTEELLANESDTEVQEALRDRQKELSSRLQNYNINGLQVTGADLKGKGAALQVFRLERPFVRVMELNQGSRRNAAIPPIE